MKFATAHKTQSCAKCAKNILSKTFKLYVSNIQTQSYVEMCHDIQNNDLVLKFIEIYIRKISNEMCQDKQNKNLCSICQHTQNKTFKLNVPNTQNTILY